VARLGKKITAYLASTVLGISALGQIASVSSADGSVTARAACDDFTNVYKMSLPALRQCGDKILPLLKVTPLPGGGKRYDYGAYTRNIPPAGFQVLTATDKQLAEFGFPTHKQLGSRWPAVMGRFRKLLPAGKYMVMLPAGTLRKPKRSSASSSAQPSTVPSTTANWAGHVVTGHTYNEVLGTWSEPHIVSGCTGAALAQWVGLGGLGTGSGLDLAQDGTMFNYTPFTNLGHQGFIERIVANSGNAVAAQGFTPAAGDSVFASVTWNGTDTYAYFMQDGSNSFSANSRASTTRDNSTAEAITERPLEPQLANMEDFQPINVTGTESFWNGGSAGFVNNPSHDSVAMTGGGPTNPTLVSTSNLTATSNFTNTWHQCS
jgi:hypothetical protein